MWRTSSTPSCRTENPAELGVTAPSREGFPLRTPQSHSGSVRVAAWTRHQENDGPCLYSWERDAQAPRVRPHQTVAATTPDTSPALFFTPSCPIAKNYRG